MAGSQFYVTLLNMFMVQASPTVCGNVRALGSVLVLIEGLIKTLPKEPLISYGAVQLNLFTHN